MKALTLFIIIFLSLTAIAESKKTSILINTDILADYGYDFKQTDSEVTSFSATDDDLENFMILSHEYNRCGGFEILSKNESKFSALTSINTQIYNDQVAAQSLDIFNPVILNKNILNAIELLNSNNLKETVTNLSAYKTRSSRSRNPNKHVYFMKELVDKILKQSNLKANSELITHNKTKQNTLKVTIKGSERPDEIVVLGGHLDSTSFFSSAPGADDNASGSANLLEILRVLTMQEQPQRTIEIFWYAAEEIGLVGSSEIASKYEKESIDVVAVLQLDMTGFPGSNVMTIANVMDYTTPGYKCFYQT